MALAVRILEELAKKGYKVEAKLATETTEAVEGLVAKAKAGKLEIGNVSFKEGTAVNKMTEALLNSMKRADGTLSRSAVLDLHQAYTSAAIKEFGRGPAAEEALETFRKTVSTTWKETRATTPSDTRLTVAAAERDARRAAGSPPPRQDGPAQAPAPAPRPEAPRDDHETAAQKAARATAQETNRIKNVNDTFGARSDVTKGLREFEEGSFAQKKAAFDKVSNAIEGSGLIARPGSAEEAKALASTAQAAGQAGTAPAVRSVEDVKKILLSRPGMDDSGNFINGVISVDEWSALRKSMRTELLQSEQQMIFSRVDQARLGNKRIDTMSGDMARLREIMLDKDFNPNAGAAAAKPRGSFNDIEADLRAGKPVSPQEIDKLAVSYKRWYASSADQKADSGSPGRVGQAIDALGRGTNAVFSPVDRHLDRTPFPRVAPVAGTLAGTFLLASALSAPVTYFSPDNEIPLMGNLGRRVTANLPFGFAGNVPGASWLPEIYFSKAEADADYRRSILEATPDQIAAMNSSKQQARTVLVERANTEREKRTAESATKKDLTEQQARTGSVDASRQVAQQAMGTYVPKPGTEGAEKGATSEEVDQALTRLYRDDVITADQLDRMAADLAKKGSILTKKELGEVEADNKLTNAVPATGYQQLERILGPKFTP